MKKKIHLKRRRKLKKSNLFIITLVFVLIGVFFLLNVINERFTPILLETAELEI